MIRSFRSNGSKYNSRKIERDGMTFDSLKEYRRFCELSLLEKAGKIADLQRQVKFVLIPAQYERYERYSDKTGKRLKDGIRTIEQECAYVADFVYYQDGQRIVEDVKGYKQSTAYAVFVIKRKLMLSVHGIRIKEI